MKKLRDYILSWYNKPHYHHSKDILVTVVQYGGRFKRNGRWIFIPKGSKIHYLCDKDGNVDREKYRKKDEATKLPK